MSLDVYLIKPDYDYINNSIFDDDTSILFEANITHNLNKMAKAANIYEVLWRPDENGYIKAKDIVQILEKGLDDLISRPSYFQKFNSPNGWGTYENMLPFVSKYLEACKKHPESIIIVSR